MELEKWKSGKMENSEKIGKKLQTMRPYATNCHLGLTHCPGFLEYYVHTNTHITYVYPHGWGVTCFLQQNPGFLILTFCQYNGSGFRKLCRLLYRLNYNNSTET